METVAVYAVDVASGAEGVSVAVFVVLSNETVEATDAPDGSLRVTFEVVTVAGLTAPENVALTVAFARTPVAFAAGIVELTVSGGAAPFGVTDTSTK